MAFAVGSGLSRSGSFEDYYVVEMGDTLPDEQGPILDNSPRLIANASSLSTKISEAVCDSVPSYSLSIQVKPRLFTHDPSSLERKIMEAITDIFIYRCSIRKGELLGEGCFGVVQKCVMETATGTKELALKVTKLDITKLSDAVNEVEIVRRLSHVHLCPYIRVEIKRLRNIIDFQVYLPCYAKDLQKWIEKERSKTSLEEYDATCIRVARQVFSAIEYLHGQGIVHRDIKHDNIFLDASGNAILGDFGHANMKGSPSKHYGGPGFVCPPLSEYKWSRYTKELAKQKTDRWIAKPMEDWWAFTIVLVMLIKRRQVYSKEFNDYYPFICPTIVLPRSFFEDFNEARVFPIPYPRAHFLSTPIPAPLRKLVAFFEGAKELYRQESVRGEQSNLCFELHKIFDLTGNRHLRLFCQGFINLQLQLIDNNKEKYFQILENLVKQLQRLFVNEEHLKSFLGDMDLLASEDHRELYRLTRDVLARYQEYNSKTEAVTIPANSSLSFGRRLIAFFPTLTKV